MHLQDIRLLPERYPRLDCYPFNQAVMQSTRLVPLVAPVTFFVGENGTGKSTLLRAVVRKCGIHIWRHEDGARYQWNPYEEQLHEFVEVTWTNGRVPGAFFGSETFRDFAQILDEWAAADPGQLQHFGGQSLITQSHGQSLMSYFTARYRIPGLYLLDEPETALSPRSQLQLLRLLVEMSRAGHAQFIIASHSPILTACPGAQLLSFDRVPVQPIAYEETENYRIYKQFMQDPATLIGGLDQ